MKVGIVICTDNHDTCFLAIRYDTFHLRESRDVGIYSVSSGLGYELRREAKNIFQKQISDFIQSGGQFYMNVERDTLKHHLERHFGHLVLMKLIKRICYDDKFQSIMTRDTYLKKFST